MRKLLIFLLLAVPLWSQTIAGGKTIVGGKAIVGNGAARFVLAHTPAGSNSACVSTVAACAVTLPNATTIGNVGEFIVLAGANVTLSSISGGGGTWNVFGASGSGCADFFAGAGTYVSCGYNLAYGSSTTSITITLSAAPGAGNPYIYIYFEYSVVGTAPTLDTSGSRTQSTTASPIAGVTLTLANFNEVVIQCQGYGTPTAINPPYSNFTNPGGGELSCADNENTGNGGAPTWLQSAPAFGIMIAIAIK